MKYLLIILILASLLSACGSDDEVVVQDAQEAVPIEQGTPELKIVNDTDFDICDIAITPSWEEEFGDNILADVLAAGDSIVYTDFEPDSYDLLAIDCSAGEGEVVAEEYNIELGVETVVWQISVGLVMAGESGQAQTQKTPPERSVTTDLGQGESQFHPAACPFDIPAGLILECGYLTVPENRTRSASPTIELATAILRAPGQNVQPDPIIYLAGGPGGSALADFIGEPEAWTDYAFSRDRDLIFIDQRGTGYSSPTLNCPEIETAVETGPDADLACHDRLVAEGIDLSAYNTAENAADIAALTKTLGYSTWNILGISYGTRLGLAIMRDHPQGLRSVVLDSPFPPNADTPGDEAINTMAALRRLFRDCQNSPPCRTAYPDLEAVLLDTVARLNEEPEEDIYGDDLVLTLEGAMNAGADFIYLLPLLIYDVAQGDFSLYEEIAAEVNSGGATRFQAPEADREDSEGMYNSVICHDEFAFGDYDQAEARAMAEIPEALQSAIFGGTENLFEVCAAWDAGAAAPRENQAVSSDIPTLILVGQYDPATPPEWGRLTAQTLSRAFYFEFPGAGHSLLSSIDCAIQITNEFFADPTAEPDHKCLDEMRGPDFELP